AIQVMIPFARNLKPATYAATRQGAKELCILPRQNPTNTTTFVRCSRAMRIAWLNSKLRHTLTSRPHACARDFPRLPSTAPFLAEAESPPLGHSRGPSLNFPNAFQCSDHSDGVTMSTKYVYFFGGKTAEGNGKMKELLGGKGANLAEMCLIGLPVP